MRHLFLRVVTRAFIKTEHEQAQQLCKHEDADDNISDDDLEHEESDDDIGDDELEYETDDDLSDPAQDDTVMAD